MTVTADKVRTLFDPRTVAFVGAQEGGFTSVIRSNLEASGFAGQTYYVNPSRTEIWGERCYSSLTDLPQAPDHVSVMVPAKVVPSVIEEALSLGTSSATVYASGIGVGEGEAGAALASRLGSLIDGRDFAMTGPNCLGNLAATTGFANLTAKMPFSPDPAPVALVGQSGGVILFAARTLHKRGTPVAYAVTTGNELGLTVGNFIEYFAQEDHVRVVMIFLEAIRDRETFIRACEEARRQNTAVVAIKVGGTEEARESAKAHTGALVGSMEAFDALCEDLGVIRAHSLEEGIELVEMLSHAKRPRNDGVAAVVYSGGLRSLILEAAAQNGVEFAPLRADTARRLEELLPMGGHVGNPLDIGFLGLTREEVFAQCVQVLADAPEFGTVLVQENLPDDADTPRSPGHLRRLNDIAATTDTSISIFSLLKDSTTEYGRVFREGIAEVGVLQGVGDAIAATARERRRRAPRPPTGEVDVARSAEATALMAGIFERGAASETEAKSLVREFGIALPEEAVVHDERELADAAGRIGYPIVLKGVTAEVAHKSDLGLVELRLADEQQAVAAHRRILDAARDAGVRLDGVLVTQMVTGGIELLVAVHHDVEVGHVVTVGSGGLNTELYADVATGTAATMTPERAQRLLRGTRVFHLLDGYRGGPRYDVDAAANAIAALARLSIALPEVDILEVNPLLVLPEGLGAVALDALLVTRDMQGAER